MICTCLGLVLCLNEKGGAAAWAADFVFTLCRIWLGLPGVLCHHGCPANIVVCRAALGGKAAVRALAASHLRVEWC